jgi:hypothetical protein
MAPEYEPESEKERNSHQSMNKELPPHFLCHHTFIDWIYRKTERLKIGSNQCVVTGKESNSGGQVP